jgi:hypothetical protein
VKDRSKLRARLEALERAAGATEGVVLEIVEVVCGTREEAGLALAACGDDDWPRGVVVREIVDGGCVEAGELVR